MIKFKELIEKAGAGDWGTDELRKTLEKGTPGQGITDTGIKNKERKESVELDEGKLDKSSPIYKEYEALKKKPVADLRNIIGRSHRVVDLKGYDKAGAIRQILDDKHGEKKVDAFFGFTEEVELDEAQWGADNPYKKYKNDPEKLRRMLKKNQDAAGNMRNRISKFMGSSPQGLKDELKDIENRVKQIKDAMRESVELDEEKVIKIVSDTNTQKYKKGEVIKTFPETKAGLTRAMAHQVTLKNKHGVPTTVVRESVELDEAKGTGVKKFIKNMRVAKLHNPDMKGTVVKGGDNLKKGVEVEWDSGKTTVTSGKYLMSIKKNESVELDELDSKTYRSYHDKATADQLKRMDKKKRSKEDQRIMRKRSLGIATAQGKQYGDKRSMKQRIRGEEVELDEGAVAVSTVEKDIRKNGGTRVKKDDRSITFMYKGSEHKVPVDRGFVKSDHYMKLQDMMEEVDLQERPFGDDGILKTMMPGIMRFLDRTVNAKRYKFAVRYFLDLRKKNPGDARRNLVKTAQVTDVDVRTLDRLFRDMVKKGVMPKHLIDYHPTFVEGKSFKEIAEKACWDGYKQIGTKKKNGKEVPNCVPEETEIEEGSETWEAGYKRRVVKTTKPEHKEKGYNWRIKGKDRPEISIKLYKEKPSQEEFNKQMKRVAGHEFGG